MKLNHMGTREIETDRLLLRKFKYEDNNSMRKNWISNPNIQKIYSEPVYTTNKETKELLNRYIENYENKNYYRWNISIKGNNDSVGQIAYFLIDDKNHFGEIEYCIGEKFQNKGYITEAVKAIIGFGLKEIGLNKVQVCHKSNNPASRRVIEKSGFKYEGTLREYFYMDGEYIDRLYYSILKREWKMDNE